MRIPVTKITKSEIENLRMILEAAQSHIGATPPTEIEDDDPDDIQHWRDIDEGLAVLTRLEANLNAKYVVCMEKPFWADARFSAMRWYFWKTQHTLCNGAVPTGIIVQCERLHRAFVFETLAAAEAIAAQFGGTVATYDSQSEILAANVLDGDPKSIECAKHINEANKL